MLSWRSNVQHEDVQMVILDEDAMLGAGSAKGGVRLELAWVLLCGQSRPGPSQNIWIALCEHTDGMMMTCGCLGRWSWRRLGQVASAGRQPSGWIVPARIVGV